MKMLVVLLVSLFCMSFSCSGSGSDLDVAKHKYYSIELRAVKNGGYELLTKDINNSMAKYYIVSISEAYDLISKLTGQYIEYKKYSCDDDNFLILFDDANSENIKIIIVRRENQYVEVIPLKYLVRFFSSRCCAIYKQCEDN